MERPQSRRFSLCSTKMLNQDAQPRCSTKMLNQDAQPRCLTKMLDEMIDQAISHCRMVEKLGGSGMGGVDKAEETSPGRFVARKLLPDRFAQVLRSLERFRRHARGIPKAPPKVNARLGNSRGHP
jgi:hypothetical protein